MRLSSSLAAAAPHRQIPWSDAARGESLWLFAFLACQPVILATFVLGYRRSWSAWIADEAPFWLMWLAFYPLIRALHRRTADEAVSSAVMRGVIRAAAAVGIIALHQLMSAPLRLVARNAVGWSSDWRAVLIEGQAEMQMLAILVYALLATHVAAVDHRERLTAQRQSEAQLRARLADARFHALRAQLNPHFLFNGLNTLAMLIRDDDKATAVRFLAGMSDLLRDVLTDGKPQELPLRAELAFIEKYLGIERLRLSDRFTTTIDATPEALDALLPTLLLQPLVENAVRHGISRRIDAGRLEIRARRVGRDLQITISDDGAGLAPDVGSSGVGLRLTEQRLRELYGDAASVHIESNIEGPGVLAAVTLPYHTRTLPAVGAA